MAHLFKVKTTKPIPPDAAIVTKDGKKYVRLKRGGRSALHPVAKGGKRYTQESRKWYVQYKDSEGAWQRTPGYTDKEATAQLAAELERSSERQESGLADAFKKGKSQTLKSHVDGFRKYLEAKSNTTKHINLTCGRVEKVIEGCKFVRWRDIKPAKLRDWLADQRSSGTMGIKTRNHYLSAFKEFCNWLVRDGHTPSNPVAYLQAINPKTDVRRQRRALSADEFTALVAAAESGPPIQEMAGADRAMLYILAAWTGYRRKELASLTKKSFKLNSKPPTVTVTAAYSKRRRQDVVPLHPEVATRVKSWLATKKESSASEPVFNLVAPGGGLRRTSKMMKLDLERARQAWIEGAKKNKKERKRREESDTLKYEDEQGMYADFHANRHTFISNLAKSGVSPKVAQTMARHSDINLTMNVYSHVKMEEQAAAIQVLPSPPKQATQNGRKTRKKRA
ncbi:MAG: tyrosine-type recombinase/integrase [Planctomycetales bacterium]|nr:tyrosine-type recombinase/integrase [Planctomycetales bacterium]